MTDRNREQLLGYLIGALEDSEHRWIEAQLQRDSGMREELSRLRERLRPLEQARRTFPPPRGLAARTCRWIAAAAPWTGKESSVAAAASAPRPARPLARRMGSAYAPPSSPAPWSWADLAVVACISAALAMLLFPAIQRSRMNMRLIACQDNLRQLGMNLAQLHERHPEFLAPLFHPKREAIAELPPSLLSREEIARIEELRQLRRPLPAERVAAQMSVHPGIERPVRGQNVLCVDGRVMFVVTGPAWPSGEDEVPGRRPLPNVLTSDRPDEGSAAPVIPVILFGP